MPLQLPNEIEEMPDFVGTVDPMVEHQLSEGDRILAKMFSRQDKQLTWLSKTVVTAHNLAVRAIVMYSNLEQLHLEAQRQRQLDKEQGEARFKKMVLAVLGGALAIVCEELVRHVTLR